MSLNLIDEHAQYGKMANNVETHGDESVPGNFAVPVVLMLSQEQLDGLMGKYFWRSLFNVDAATQLPAPVEGFRRCKPLQLEDVYEDVTFRIGERAGGDIVHQEEFRGGEFSKVVLEPQVGGLTKAEGQIYLHAGLGDNNLWLQKLQNHEIYLEIMEGKIAKKKNPAQQSLPLGAPGSGNSTTEGASTDQPSDQGAESSPAAEDEPSDLELRRQSVTAEQDADLDKVIGRPPAFQSAGGEAANERTHRDLPEDPEQLVGDTPPTPAELAEFEASAGAQVAAFHARPGEVIDGRSERVKEQDRKRASEEAA